MSSPKEPNFFSDDEQYCKGMDWYSGLFSSGPDGGLFGEASTHYTKLPTYPQTVSRLKTHLPQARFIYVMRHPVDRLVSHYIHEWSMGVYHCNIEKAIEQYQELIAYGQYAFQLEPYFEAYGREAVLPVFFDRLTHHSQVELERICRFIGYKGAPKWADEQKPSNVSRERIRHFPLYSLLIESETASWLRRKFVPQGLRDRVKSRLTMRQRPELTNETRSELEEVFNQDLARIGDWLGLELNCENFREVTVEKSSNWIPVNGK